MLMLALGLARSHLQATCLKQSDCPIEQFCDNDTPHICWDCSYITPTQCDLLDGGSCCSPEFLIQCPSDPAECNIPPPPPPQCSPALAGCTVCDECCHTWLGNGTACQECVDVSCAFSCNDPLAKCEDCLETCIWEIGTSSMPPCLKHCSQQSGLLMTAAFWVLRIVAVTMLRSFLVKLRCAEQNRSAFSNGDLLDADRDSWMQAVYMNEYGEMMDKTTERVWRNDVTCCTWYLAILRAGFVLVFWHWLQPVCYLYVFFKPANFEMLNETQRFLGLVVVAREVMYLLSTFVLLIPIRRREEPNLFLAAGEARGYWNFFKPAFLLISVDASIRERNARQKNGTAFLAMYTLAPEKFLLNVIFQTLMWTHEERLRKQAEQAQERDQRKASMQPSRLRAQARGEGPLTRWDVLWYFGVVSCFSMDFAGVLALVAGWHAWLNDTGGLPTALIPGYIASSLGALFMIYFWYSERQHERYKTAAVQELLNHINDAPTRELLLKLNWPTSLEQPLERGSGLIDWQFTHRDQAGMSPLDAIRQEQRMFKMEATLQSLREELAKTRAQNGSEGVDNGSGDAASMIQASGGSQPHQAVKVTWDLDAEPPREPHGGDHRAMDVSRAASPSLMGGSE